LLERSHPLEDSVYLSRILVSTCRTGSDRSRRRGRRPDNSFRTNEVAPCRRALRCCTLRIGLRART
jgi:hypothetical protein